MKLEEVPQDKLRHYEGQHKILYAQDVNGAFRAVKSSGWTIEETATLDAVAEYQRLAAEALKLVKEGQASPLMFHMYQKRMDIPFLAQAMGIFQWQLKRHLKPKGFAKLSPKKRQAYADLMGMPLASLAEVPADI